MYNIVLLGGGAWGKAIKNSYQSIHDYYCTIVNQSNSLDVYPNNPIDSVFITVSTAGLAWACDALNRLYEKGFISNTVPIVVCTKGIHEQSGMFATHHVQSHMNSFNVGVLSGPTFANQLSPFEPSCADLAFSNLQEASQQAKKLQNASLHLFPTIDITGVSLGGIYKNILAIFSGILRGCHASDNMWSWVMTLGFREFYTLGLSMNAYPETMLGYSGLGDIFLSITSKESRNFYFGWNVLNETSDGQGLVTIEGIANINRLIEMAKFQGIVLPLCLLLTELLEDMVNEKKEKITRDEIFKRLQALL